MKSFTELITAFCYLLSYPTNPRNSSTALLSRDGPHVYTSKMILKAVLKLIHQLKDIP